MSSSVIFHIDVNSAFLSWNAIRELSEGKERDLRTIPSIVGGDIEKRRGVVLAKSIPAKRFGVKTGEPVISALKKCPGLVTSSPDHHYYKEKSRELMEYLSGICPAIEQVSVDECYMDYSLICDQYPSPEYAANLIKNNIFRLFGYTVNIGISDRKVLAKMASDFKKPNLVHTLYHHEIRQKMWPLPVSDLYMCGKSSTDRLNTLGIFTIGDLACCDKNIIISHLKKQGQLLYEYANGIDDTPVHVTPRKAKGIGNSTTLSQDVTSRKDALKVLKTLSETVARRLKKDGFYAGCVCIEIKYSSFESVSHQCILPSSSQKAEQIYGASVRLFDELWKGEPIRLLGIRTTKLSADREPVQLSFSDFEKQRPRMEKQQKIEEAMKKIRNKYGHDAIHRGPADY